ESPWVRERREEQARSDQLAEINRRLDPGTIADARVEINRPRTTMGQRRAPSATAFVYLETLDDREVNPLTVQSIVGMVASFAPEVRPDSVSLWDRRGRHYADAHDPALVATARARARAWELGQEIRDNLDWIKGVKVSVHLTAAEPSPVIDPPSIAPSPAPAPLVLPPLPDDPPPPPPADEVRLATPNVGVNQPLELEPTEPERDPEPEPTPTPEPRPSIPTEPAVAPREAAVPVSSPASRIATPSPSVPPSKVQVWVKIPRSYYLKALQSREPSLDDLQTLVARTELHVRTAVEHVVPADERGEVKVNTIPDEWPAPAFPPPASADVARPWPWWGSALAGAGSAVLVIGLSSRLWNTRRSALRQATRSDRGRFKIDEGTDHTVGPGPSERVRELIRLNPEAAASVLLRWTGQGGPAA
ncbi:MAG: hypothetical protein AB7I30_20940, partial [Isosphaeraceae bacterium]